MPRRYRDPKEIEKMRKAIVEARKISATSNKNSEFDKLGTDLCIDENCEGDVGKFGPFYLKYIGNALSNKAIPARFFDKWDQAIVTQIYVRHKLRIRVPDLRKTAQYRQIQTVRVKWLDTAQEMGLKKWKEMVKIALKKNGDTDRAIRSKIRNALKYKELQLKF